MMTFGQDLDAMIAARNAREWEDQNAEPEMDVCGCVSQLGYAWDKMCEAYDHLAEADGMAEGFPAEHRIQSVLDTLENLKDEIRKIQREVKDA